MAANYPQIAKEVRKDVLALIHKGQTSHIASCFSLVDMAVVLYENLKPDDVVVWSKGWAAALHYVLEIRRGNLDRAEVFSTFPNSPYLALLERSCPTVLTAGGSVGHGLPIACGMALARKLQSKPGKVYVLCSDGEMNEGTTWEAAMFAKHHKLDNLVVLVDRNGWQAMGRAKDVMGVEIPKVFSGFEWATYQVDGHDYDSLEWLITEEELEQGKPVVLVCETVKGRGISFFEDSLVFHYRHVDDEVYAKALAELNSS